MATNFYDEVLGLLVQELFKQKLLKSLEVGISGPASLGDQTIKIDVPQGFSYEAPAKYKNQYKIVTKHNEDELKMTATATKAGEIKMTCKDVEIKREGKQIVLPKDMSYDEGIEWLRRKREEDERDIGIHYEFHYSPMDGAVAFHRALAELHGWAELVPTPGFWGPTPPTMIGVPISLTEVMQVPWGRVMIPGIEGHLQTGIQAEPTPRFVINGKVKQKNKEQVAAIAEKTRELLRERSIYRRQAVKISFKWQREGREFSPSEHCPKFMPLEGVDENDLIFGSEVTNALNIGLFAPIEYSDACRKYKVPLKRGVLLYGPYGVGKCLAKDTPVLMYDGRVNKVQDIKPGDCLMGPDSKMRIVQSVCKGRDKMYKVKPRKGDPYIVNSAHILSLKITSEWCAGRYGKHGDVVNMNVQEYAALPSFVRQGLAGWRAGIEFEHKDVKLDPYFVGLWLGDGDSRNPAVTTADTEIEQYVREVAAQYNLLIREAQPSGENNLSMTYHITAGNSGTRNNMDHGQSHGSMGRNPVRSLLQEYSLLQNKHIPVDYKCNTRECRLRLLAGLVDTDGSRSNNCLEIITKFDQLSEDILYLCRSLGFAAYKSRKFVEVSIGKHRAYWRIVVSGDLSEIPTSLANKQFDERKQKKSVLVTRLEVEELPEDDYYGFVIDGDHLFMLGDFTVTHNTLTATVTALKGVKSGFTFLYLESVLDLEKGLQLASQYAPAIVFAEDIDRVLEGDRSLDMDTLLNIMDGCDTKGGEVVTVFTTNHVENINPALLRMGRLDSLVEVKPPDATSAIKLVRLYGRDLFAQNADFTEVGKVLAGRIPAFIREVTERAKIAAIFRLKGGNIEGQVKVDDLLAAAEAMKNHANMLEPKRKEIKLSTKHAHLAEELLNTLVPSMLNGEEVEEEVE
jgi:hypothetical protein